MNVEVTQNEMAVLYFSIEAAKSNHRILQGISQHKKLFTVEGYGLYISQE